MQAGFIGIERRLDELTKRLVRLKALSAKSRNDFDGDTNLRDGVEFNFQIVIQCCIDISHLITALTKARKPTDDCEALFLMGDLGVLPIDLALRLGRLTDFQNILMYEYLSIDWDEVYGRLENLDDLVRFDTLVREWLVKRAGVA